MKCTCEVYMTGDVITNMLIDLDCVIHAKEEMKYDHSSFKQ